MEWKKLPEVCDIKTGKKDANHAKENGKYRFYTCANHYSLCDTYSFSGESIIVPGNGDIGLVFYYNGDFEAYQRTYVLSNIKICAKYLYFYFVYKWRSQNTSKQFGSTVKYVRMQNFNDFLVPVPPLPEQQRIVAKIEELFAELDNSVAMLKKVKEQLEVYRQCVLDTILWEKYEMVSLNSISMQLSGYAFKSKDYVDNGEYVVIKIGNVKKFHFTFERECTKIKKPANDILNKFLLKQGDCIITLTGSRGKRDYGFVSMIRNEKNFLLNQRVAALRFIEKKVFPEFFQYYLMSTHYRNQFFSYETGNVGQGNVGIKALKEPLVPLPSYKEQIYLTNLIKDKLKIIDTIHKSIETEDLTLCDALRQSILKKAFEGEL